MAQHAPLFPDGPITCVAGAAIAAGQLVYVNDTGREVSPTAGISSAWLGVAATDAAEGDKVTVHRGGVQRITASGAISAGALVTSAADGKVAALAAVTTPTANDVTHTRAIVGIALTTGTDVPVEIALSR